MSREHVYRPARAHQIAQDVAVGDLVYVPAPTTGEATGMQQQKHLSGLRHLRPLLIARGLGLRDRGGFHHEVIELAAQAPQTPTSCTCCGYRVAHGRCQRCGTSFGTLEGMHS